MVNEENAREVLREEEKEEEEEDDIAELFSFGCEEVKVSLGDTRSGMSESAELLHPSSSNVTVTPPSSQTSAHHYSPNSHRTELSIPSGFEKGDERERATSQDSFLELLESEGGGSTATFISCHSPTPLIQSSFVDDETREILDWLQEDGAFDKVGTTSLQKEELSGPDALASETTSTQLPTALFLTAAAATVVALPPSFKTLHEALLSTESSSKQILHLVNQNPDQLIEINGNERTALYCKLLCGKTLDQVQQSSLADSFIEYKGESWPYTIDDTIASRTAAYNHQSMQAVTEDLQHVLGFYFSRQNTEDDPLIPPVAATLLAIAPSSASVVSVLLHKMVNIHMPVLALQASERWDAVLLLHQELYLLANYHIPLLVYHLDRYLPGWYWPSKASSLNSMLNYSSLSSATSPSTSVNKNGKRLQNRGFLPQSWLLSHFAGECGTAASSSLDLNQLLKLWDTSLLALEHASATRFFLVLVVLDNASDDLLLRTGDDLLSSFQNLFRLERTPEHWLSKAQLLQEWTPESVWMKLITAEDRAVQQSLQQRQERTQRELQLKLEAEAETHRVVQEQKAAAARERLARARLVEFYRKFAPDKESNIDKIMETYAGDWETLDAKLKIKYGEGFNPPIKKSPPAPTSSPFLGMKNKKLISTMNTSRGARRDSDRNLHKKDDESEAASEQVSVLVAASEVLPVICWSKEAVSLRGQQRRRRLTDKKQLKFFLVDSRSEESVTEQGRFPTAVSLSPETMLDPERLKESELMLESLRGVVHIVIMGEGFSALPFLYDHKLSPKLVELMHEDESRTNICALFFVKKGFPFVSILDGGFAAAHSWLVRNGPSQHLTTAAVLVDYDPEASVFGQLELMHNATATEKAQRRIQNLIDKSLLAMALRVQQMERMDVDTEKREQLTPGERKFFGKPSPLSQVKSKESLEKAIVSGSDITQPIIPVVQLPLSTGSSEASDATDDKATDIQNRFGLFRGNKAEMASSSTASSAQQQASNMLKGLGAAFNQSIKNTDVSQATNNVLKRNPFARFGGTVAPVPVSVPSTVQNSGGGGWNSLRKAAMARMRSTDPTADSSDCDEESISFGESSKIDATGAGETPPSEVAPTQAQVQQV